jgi:hypothetical protein
MPVAQPLQPDLGPADRLRDRERGNHEANVARLIDGAQRQVSDLQPRHWRVRPSTARGGAAIT